MNKNFPIKSSFLVALFSLSLGIPVKAADLDYTDDRLRKLWLSFSESDSSLKTLANKETCSEEDLAKANGLAANITSIKREIDVVVNGLTGIVNGKKVEIEKLEKEVSLSSNQRPNNFLGAITELMRQPRVLIKEEKDALIQLVNNNTRVTFTDSKGVKQIANKENLSALDKESKAVLLNVGLSWLADGSALQRFNYDEASVDKTKSKQGSLVFLTANASEKFSHSARELILNSNITVEAIAGSFGSELNGAQGLNKKLENDFRKSMEKFGLKELKDILQTVSDRNAKEAFAKKLAPEVIETKNQKIAALKREVQPLEDSLFKKWKETQGRVDPVELALKIRLNKCKAANKAVRAKAGKPVDQVPEAEKADPFLKSIGVDSHKAPAPKK